MKKIFLSLLLILSLGLSGQSGYRTQHSVSIGQSYWPDMFQRGYYVDLPVKVTYVTYNDVPHSIILGQPGKALLMFMIGAPQSEEEKQDGDIIRYYQLTSSRSAAYAVKLTISFSFRKGEKNFYKFGISDDRRIAIFTLVEESSL